MPQHSKLQVYHSSVDIYSKLDIKQIVFVLLFSI